MFNRFYINVPSLFVTISQIPIISVSIFKRLYTYIYKYHQYNNNRADIWMQLNGALFFWASKSPLEDYHSKQLLASSICRPQPRFCEPRDVCLHPLSCSWRKTALAVQRHENLYITQQYAQKTPTLMCIQCVWLVQSQRLIHGFIKVSEHCYSAKMMPTFLFCCFALIWASWRRCTCGRHLNANILSWFNARKKSPKWLFWRMHKCYIV